MSNPIGCRFSPPIYSHEEMIKDKIKVNFTRIYHHSYDARFRELKFLTRRKRGVTEQKKQGNTCKRSKNTGPVIFPRGRRAGVEEKGNPWALGRDAISPSVRKVLFRIVHARNTPTSLSATSDSKHFTYLPTTIFNRPTFVSFFYYLIRKMLEGIARKNHFFFLFYQYNI